MLRFITLVVDFDMSTHHDTNNSYNTLMRFVSYLQTQHLRVQPNGSTITNQIQTKWMCYYCFVLWCVSGSKAPLACVWNEGEGASGLADGKRWVSCH